MKTIKVIKLGKEWYVRVFEGKVLKTQASFSTKKAATTCQKHWIEMKTFGEAVEG